MKTIIIFLNFRLDPSNIKAWDGISKIEKQSNIGLKCTYYNEEEEIEGSENEVRIMHYKI